MKKILIPADVIDPRQFKEGDDILVSAFIRGGPGGVHRVVKVDEHGVHVVKKTCKACIWEARLVTGESLCAHSDGGFFPTASLERSTSEGGHCGPTRKNFEQHPMRNMDGSRKTS